MKFHKKSMGALLVIASTIVSAQIPVNGPAEAWTNAQIAEETATVSNSINIFGSSLMTTFKLNIERLLSALHVATKQEALSSNDFQTNLTHSFSAFVNALRAQQQMSVITKAYVDFNPLTGQGYDPCGTSAKNKQMDKAYSSLNETAVSTMSKMPVLNAALVDSSQAWQDNQIKTHREKFCSQSEADAGLCSLSTVPSGDTNGALFFESVDANSLKKEARIAYMNNLMGTPFQKIHGTPTNEQAKQYLFEQNHYTALMSVPAYSLAMIDAENTRDSKTKVSPMEQLDNRINQYFGGKEAQGWASTIATQTPRGLLVETAKIEGLSAWQNFKAVEQNNRILANIATLALASSEPLKANLENKVNQATGVTSTNSINGAIK